MRIAIGLAATSLFTAAIALQAGYDPFDAQNYARWDSGHYLSIAAAGYRAQPCADAPGPCGNTAWLPGYSFLIRLTASLFPSLELGGLFWNLCCYSLALVLLLQNLPSRPGQIHYGLLFLFPGSIYYHAIFPQGLFLLCVVLAAGCVVRERFVCAGLALATGLVSYSTGWASLVLFNLYLCFQFLLIARGLPANRRNYLQRIAGSSHESTDGRTDYDERVPPVVRTEAGTMKPGLWGLGAQILRLNAVPVFILPFLFLLFSRETGQPLAYIDHQQSYGRSPENPLVVLGWMLEHFLHTPYPSVRTAAAQSFFVVLLLVLSGMKILRRRDAGVVPILQLLYFHSLGIYLLALSFGQNISLYRQEALLVPLALLLPHSRLLLIVSGCFFLLMSHFFFRSLIV